MAGLLLRKNLAIIDFLCFFAKQREKYIKLFLFPTREKISLASPLKLYYADKYCIFFFLWIKSFKGLKVANKSCTK